MLSLDFGITPDLQGRYTTASRKGLFAITSTGYEAELHNPARRARRRRDVSCGGDAPQLPPCGGGPWGLAVGRQPGGSVARSAGRGSASLSAPGQPSRSSSPPASRRAI